MIEFGQRAFQSGSERDVARAARNQEQQSRRRLLANHVRDQIKAATIGPLQIVEDQHEAVICGDRCQKGANGLVQAQARLFCR